MSISSTMKNIQKFYCTHIYLLVLIASTNAIITVEEETLVIVHALFRHGNRTPLYPSYLLDPYGNLSYYPYDPGQLTNVGKVNAYNRGRSLRLRYRRFLGDVYRPRILEASSTSTDRTQMTLQLVLAGLFPPVGGQVWNPELRWQPIPYDHSRNTVLSGAYCPAFSAELRKLHQTREYQRSLAEDREILDYISEHTGMELNSYLPVTLLYIVLQVEQEIGLKLPKWTEKVFPHPMDSLVIKFLKSLTTNSRLSRLSAGYLLRKIISDTLLKISGNVTMERTKIVLYSGHDVNVVSLLQTLGVFDGVLPVYTACVLLEVHEIVGEYGIRIVYINGDNPVTLKLKGCSEICPIEQFVNIVNEYIPEDNECDVENKANTRIIMPIDL